MSHQLAAVRVALFGACVLAGCSAIIGDYDLVDCDPDGTICAKLNAGIEGQCYEYVCSESGYGCVLRESDRKEDGVLTEICDGLDNDCNERIDEGVIQDLRSDEVPIGEGVERLSHAVTHEGALLLALTKPAEPPSYIVVDESGGEAEDFPKQDCLAGGGVTEKCRLEQIALAAGEDAVVAAAIHHSACDGGQLRIGVGSSSSFGVELGEAARLSRSALGIDIDFTQGCSVSAGCAGVSEPVIAMLPGRTGAGPEALVAFLAKTAASADGCQTSTEGRIGLVGASISSAGEGFRLSTRDDERSTLLSEDNASGPPALTAIAGSGAGYVVAFPSGDLIRLAFVPSVARASDVDADAVISSFEARDASNLSLAADHTSAGGGLAVAYLTEADGKPAIALSSVVLDKAGRLVNGASGVTRRRRSIVAGPQLSYASKGFSVEGAGRQTGGWSVIWIERSASTEAPLSLMLWRVAEQDFRPLGDPMAVATGSLSLPFVYQKHGVEEEGAVKAGFVEGDVLHLTDLSCVRYP